MLIPKLLLIIRMWALEKRKVGSVCWLKGKSCCYLGFLPRHSWSKVILGVCCVRAFCPFDFLCKVLYEHSYEQRVRLVWFLIFMDLHLGRWVLALTTECGTGLPVLLSSLTWLQWGDRAPKLWSAGILRAPSSAFSKCPWYPWDPLGADVQSFTHLSNWDWLLQSCLPSNL